MPEPARSPFDYYRILLLLSCRSIICRRLFSENLSADARSRATRLAFERDARVLGLHLNLSLLLFDLLLQFFTHALNPALPLAGGRGLLLLQEAVAVCARLSQRVLVARQALRNAPENFVRLAGTSARAVFALAQHAVDRLVENSVQHEDHRDDYHDVQHERAVGHELDGFGKGQRAHANLKFALSPAQSGANLISA